MAFLIKYLKYLSIVGIASGGLGLGLTLALAPAGQALPPPEEIPEEVLRTEIIIEGRSPLTGEVLTAVEYAQLQAELRQADIQMVPETFRSAIFLLQLRRVLQPLLPVSR